MQKDGADQLLAVFVDELMPLLRPYETTIYLYLLRRTIVAGANPIRLGLRTISRECGVGTRSPSGGNIQHIAAVLRALEEKGCIEQHDRTREGRSIRVVEPAQVPAVQERLLASRVRQTPNDYYRDPVLRREIFHRDGWRCHYCRELVQPSDATLDHVLPVAAGGPNTAENLVTACLLCNSIKSGRTYEEAAPLLLDSIRRRRPSLT